MPHIFDPERRSRLDAPERDAWQMPDRVVGVLGLRPGAVVAEVGAGTGYFTRRLSAAVGPGGRIYAVDLQQKMLDALAERVRDEGLPNVTLVKSDPVAIPLPAAAADLVFLANLAHEYDDLGAGLAECARIARPGGTLAVVDWARRETPKGPPLEHRLDAAAIRESARRARWAAAGAHDFLPYHDYLVFRLNGAVDGP